MDLMRHELESNLGNFSSLLATSYETEFFQKPCFRIINFSRKPNFGHDRIFSTRKRTSRSYEKRPFDAISGRVLHSKPR